jgi:hypothetical protein
MDSAEIQRHARMLHWVFLQQFFFAYGGDFSVLDTETRQYFPSTDIATAATRGPQTNYTAHINTEFHRDIDKCWVV